VGILTEGWDSPRVDCIMMCRPTMSPGLFVQMVGRGTRKYPGKRDLLVLDLAENFRRHGDPSAPVVRWGKRAKGEELEPPLKRCPECFSMIPPSCKDCPECGYVFPEKELVEAVKAPVMEVYRKPAGGGRYGVRGHVVERCWSKQGAPMAMLRIILDGAGHEPRYWMRFDEGANEFFRKRSFGTWRRLAGYSSPVPATVDEAVDRQGELALPGIVTVYEDSNGFTKIRELD
jgi:DNA repair protein RadD